MIEELVDVGVLGSKDYNQRGYWRWEVLKPKRLPDWLESNYVNHKEIRWYGES